ncbi:hypothetical protein [Pseudobacillus wudalianchiensis]|uniref:hypothetical protein n=1 Tax=Pseudobacillus wudalianchiensis TaxID=1743143 RepID=UPI0011471F11|nr:hypothetical protein [Bacillus wudalianchiensis]
MPTVLNFKSESALPAATSIRQAGGQVFFYLLARLTYGCQLRQAYNLEQLGANLRTKAPYQLQLMKDD